MLLEMLQQGTASAMDDALRHPRRAGRVEDEQGVVEWQLFECDFRLSCGIRRKGRNELFEVLRRTDTRYVQLVASIGDHDNGFHGRQAIGDLRETRQRVMGLAVVVIAFHGKQDRRFDLAEAVKHALGSEVRRTRRPDRANACGGQHENDGIGKIGHERRNAVATPDTVGLECLDGPGHGVVQLGVAEPPADPVFAPEHDRGPVVSSPQQVLGIVQARIGKPFRAGHPVAVDQCAGASCLRHDLRKVPHRIPELFRFTNRPVIKLCRVRDRAFGVGCAVAAIDEIDKSLDVGFANPFL